MLNISAKKLDYNILNRQIQRAKEDVNIIDCYGQRFLGSGLKKNKVIINGVPGNALGSYLDGGEIVVYGNAQDAVGDTMNSGKIIIHGNAGDTLGYSMRGGSIFVKESAGYRAGIHIKAYNEICPTIIIGKTAGSFLGEYLAGGIIIVLGIDCEDIPVGNFTGTGMHGGKIFIRTKNKLDSLPPQVTVKLANSKEISKITPIINEFCEYFNEDSKKILNSLFYVLTPNTNNAYKQHYVYN